MVKPDHAALVDSVYASSTPRYRVDATVGPGSDAGARTESGGDVHVPGSAQSILEGPGGGTKGHNEEKAASLVEGPQSSRVGCRYEGLRGPCLRGSGKRRWRKERRQRHLGVVLKSLTAEETRQHPERRDNAPDSFTSTAHATTERAPEHRARGGEESSCEVPR